MTHFSEIIVNTDKEFDFSIKIKFLKVLLYKRFSFIKYDITVEWESAIFESAGIQLQSALYLIFDRVLNMSLGHETLTRD